MSSDLFQAWSHSFNVSQPFGHVQFFMFRYKVLGARYVIVRSFCDILQMSQKVFVDNMAKYKLECSEESNYFNVMELRQLGAVTSKTRTTFLIAKLSDVIKLIRAISDDDENAQPYGLLDEALCAACRADPPYSASMLGMQKSGPVTSSRPAPISPSPRSRPQPGSPELSDDCFGSESPITADLPSPPFEVAPAIRAAMINVKIGR
jgi:hypothetical protein